MAKVNRMGEPQAFMGPMKKMGHPAFSVVGQTSCRPVASLTGRAKFAKI